MDLDLELEPEARSMLLWLGFGSMIIYAAMYFFRGPMPWQIMVTLVVGTWIFSFGLAMATQKEVREARRRHGGLAATLSAWAEGMGWEFSVARDRKTPSGR